MLHSLNVPDFGHPVAVMDMMAYMLTPEKPVQIGA